MTADVMSTSVVYLFNLSTSLDRLAMCNIRYRGVHGVEKSTRKRLVAIHSLLAPLEMALKLSTENSQRKKIPYIGDTWLKGNAMQRKKLTLQKTQHKLKIC